MTRIEITDPRDERLADYVRLRETSLRRSLESAAGLFIAEGALVIRRAIEAGHRPRSFLLAERWCAGLTDVLDRWPDVPVYLVSEQLAEAVTGFHVHRGALASLHREQRYAAEDLLDGRRLVILEDIVDHANVGAIIRSAAALGWDGALLSPRCADPLYRRAIKVSMGAVFALPWARLSGWASTPSWLDDAGFVTVALTPGEGATDLDSVSEDLRRQPKLAIMVGTEGAGLSERWTAGAAYRLRIPMTAGIDSLNVAAATAIACYSLSVRGETGQSFG